MTHPAITQLLSVGQFLRPLEAFKTKGQVSLWGAVYLWEFKGQSQAILSLKEVSQVKELCGSIIAPQANNLTSDKLGLDLVDSTSSLYLIDSFIHPTHIFYSSNT